MISELPPLTPNTDMQICLFAYGTNEARSYVASVITLTLYFRSLLAKKFSFLLKMFQFMQSSHLYFYTSNGMFPGRKHTFHSCSCHFGAMSLGIALSRFQILGLKIHIFKFNQFGL